MRREIRLTIRRDATGLRQHARSGGTLARHLLRRIRDVRRGPDRVLALNGGLPAFPSRGEAGTLWWPLRPGSVDHITIDPSVRLFPGPWTDALIAYARELLVDGGQLELPPAVRARADGRRSVLSWYMQHAAEILRLSAGAGGDKGDGDAVRRLTENPGPDDAVNLTNDQRDRVNSLLATHGYLVGGLAYKAPLLARIVETLIYRSGAISHLDVGGAYGLLATELRAHSATPIAESVVVDINSGYRGLAEFMARTYDWCGDRPVQFEVGAAQDAPSTECHLATVLGALLYVPRHERRETLDRLWGLVQPGGVLVVHENIRAPSYDDAELMFEPDELDGYLSRYGTVRYFSSTTPRELTKDKVGRTTVFRAVVKE
jgi:hypothetical protein